MIPKEERIINQLLACVYTEKSDPSVYKLNFDQVLKVLIGNDFILPNRQFEDTVEKVLNAKLAGKAVVSKATKYSIAKIIYHVAEEMCVSKDDITRYHLQGKDIIAKG